jgi:beta-xylosidase
MVLASGASVNARVRDDRDRGHVGTASARDTGTGESVEHRIDRDNPVLDHDVPDPSVLVTDHGYIAFASGSGGFNVQVTQSKDLAHWREPREGLTQLPPWVAVQTPQVWGPHVVANAGRYVMVYSARDAETSRHCIGAAIADEPNGPYAPQASPLLCDPAQGGVIDPFIAVAGSTARLLWKNDGNCCGLASAIWSQPIEVRALRLVGRPTQLLGIDQSWERSADAGQTTIEAPSMVTISGRVFLFYAANGYETANYAEGYAVCASVDGACSKPRSTPLLASAGRAAGPGGGEAFRDRSGRWLFAYHAWDARAVGYEAGGRRSLRIDPILVDRDIVTIEGPTTSR